MVKTDGDRKDSPLTGTLFLTSIKSWYNKDGVHCAIENVGKPVETNDESKVSVPLEIGICEDMPKCRARVIGEDGKVVMTEDDLGNEVAKIEVISNPESVTLWMGMKVEDPENDEYKVFSMGSAFPLYNFAFAQAGEIDADNKKNIIFTYDELLDVLEGLEFRCKTETRKFNGRAYQVLIPAPL